jgi:predicted ferric reductase
MTAIVDRDQLQQYFLLGGLTGADLWPAINVVVFSYFLLFFLPRWKWTPILTLITPLFHSVLYVGSLFSFMLDVKEDAIDVDFNSFEGIVAVFRDPDIIFPAWIHYIVFDLLVSRMIVLDSLQREASVMVHILIVVPCVFCTFMVGPTGFLGYMILRQLFLPTTTAAATKTKIL